MWFNFFWLRRWRNWFCFPCVRVFVCACVSVCVCVCFGAVFCPLFKLVAQPIPYYFPFSFVVGSHKDSMYYFEMDRKLYCLICDRSFLKWCFGTAIDFILCVSLFEELILFRWRFNGAGHCVTKESSFVCCWLVRVVSPILYSSSVFQECVECVNWKMCEWVCDLYVNTCVSCLCHFSTRNPYEIYDMYVSMAKSSHRLQCSRISQSPARLCVLCCDVDWYFAVLHKHTYAHSKIAMMDIRIGMAKRETGCKCMEIMWQYKKSRGIAPMLISTKPRTWENRK